VVVVASLGVFVAFLDNTVVGIAFPNLLGSFPDAGLDGLSWVFNAYAIVFAALLVPSGRLADLLGRRRLFSAGIAIFTIASLLCAFAPSAGALIAARAVQGAGAAILVPASLALILEANPGRRRAPAVAAWSATAALAAGIGPSVGGVLVELWDWRLVFLVNVPIGVVVWRLSARRLVESRAPGRRAWPDLLGALLLAVSIAALTLAIVRTHDHGVGDLSVLLPPAVSLAGLVALQRRSRRHPAPVVDVALLRRRTFGVTSGLTLVGAVGFYGVGLANLLYLMEVWRYSPLEAGLATTPAPFVAAGAALLAGRIAAGRDARPLLLAGSLIWAAGPLFLALRAGIEPAFLTVYLPAALLTAVGVGLAFPVVSDAAVADAPGGRFASATALNSAIRELGAAIGIALLVPLLGSTTAIDFADAFDRVWILAAACFAALGVAAMLAGPLVVPSPVLAVPAPEPAAPPRPVRRPTVPAGRPSPAAGDAQPLRFLPADVLARAETVTVPGGEWLFRQGDEGDALYVVQRGRMEVVAESPGEPAQIVSDLGPGAVVGELALISGAPRNASLRARRDSVLLRLERTEFDELLDANPEFVRDLLGRVAGRLADSRPVSAPDAAVPSAVLLLAATGDDGCVRATGLIEQAFLATGDAALLDETIATEELGQALEQAERRHARVLLRAAAAGTEWALACARQVDRAIVVVGDVPQPGSPAREALPRGADVALAGPPGDPGVGPLLADIDARSSQRVRAGSDGEADAAALARRMSGRSVGLVLSGGGARGFAHIGVIEELLAAGIAIDRVGGASMGAFVGALLAAGLPPEEIDRHCYEEWVRRNPLSDYRVPRVSLIAGSRVRAMLERLLPAAIEDLVRPFFCVSTDLVTGELVVQRRGPLPLAIAASMALPAFAPPVRLGDRLLVDGGVLDNLPVATMAAHAEGPIIASDVNEPEDRHVGRVRAPERDPTLPETLYRLILLQTADTQAAAHRHAQLVITPDQAGVGRLEFHQLDRMRAEGRRAAARALAHAPPELFSA
jgi:EmrB/QacA subfamily drug resistance transporter